jgi:hypothetical protein
MSNDYWTECPKHGWYTDELECPACRKGRPGRDVPLMSDWRNDVGRAANASRFGTRCRDTVGVIRDPSGRYSSD